MDLAFAIAAMVLLCLIGGLIWARLAAGGASTWQIARMVAHLWVVLGLWVGMLLAFRAVVGVPGGAGVGNELSDLGHRLASLSASARWGAGVGLAVGVAACIHLVMRLGKAMSLHPVEAAGGEQ